MNVKFSDLEKVLGCAYMALFPSCSRLKIPPLSEQERNISALCALKKRGIHDNANLPVDPMIVADCEAWFALYDHRLESRP